MLNKKLFRLSIFFLPLTFIFSQCFNFKKQDDPRGSAYAGAASCVSCHKDIYNSSMHTAHFAASQPSNGNTIMGKFFDGMNEVTFNPHLKVVMEKHDNSYYQTSYQDGKKLQSQRFDVTFGNVKGQTYAYWVANELFQLPISYVTPAHSWINSPGYDPNSVDFARNVGMKCMNCHASYIKPAPPDLPGFYADAEGFEKNSLVYSIDCERCHGPAAAHVKFQTENPAEKKPKFIKVFSSLSRAQKINMCAICHSGGNNRMLKPAFDFKPGDTIEKYMRTAVSNQPINFKAIDVHGNQKALLESSKCFISSQMDCSTCHNTHINDRDNLTLYANKCTTCHGKNSHNSCKLTGRITNAMLLNNCISCHMPAFSSKTIVVGNKGATVHTHHITVYPDETQKVIAFIKRSTGGSH